MPSNVRVAVRVRPLLDNELKSGHQRNLLGVDSQTNQISIVNAENNTKKSYRFDKILDDNYSQQEVFETL